MDCRTIQERSLADEYRAGRLSGQEAQAYEEHYFACDRCFEDLRFRDALAHLIGQEGVSLFAPEIQAEGRERSPGTERRVLAWLTAPRAGWLGLPRWSWGVVVSSAAVVIAVLGTRLSNETTRIREGWPVLAYPYVASELRGEAGAIEFREGMECYVAGDYRGAAQWLERSARRNPSDAEILFYLGVARLMSREPAQATIALESAARLAPDSPLYRWYLAQALVRDGKLKKAQVELERLARTSGPISDDARRLLRWISGQLENPPSEVGE